MLSCALCRCLRKVVFFQAEDGIRDGTVTGVQTCALPIWPTTSQKTVLAAGFACLNVRKARSEEHTSELQSQFHLVCRLLLEKKKNQNRTSIREHTITKPSTRITHNLCP